MLKEGDVVELRGGVVAVLVMRRDDLYPMELPDGSELDAWDVETDDGDRIVAYVSGGALRSDLTSDDVLV